jgi:hypothetical protein
MRRKRRLSGLQRLKTDTEFPTLPPMRNLLF